MAEIRVNPTRMELKKLQTRYNTARRGHKLLKDKRDELMRRFLTTVRACKELRIKVEAALDRALGGLAMAGAAAHPLVNETGMLLPRTTAEVNVHFSNHMGVTLPHFDMQITGGEECANYGLAFTSAELDGAVKGLGEILPDLLRMAELEKEVELLAEEIERTRRRVNALEYSMMPKYLAAIKEIKGKLEENERGNITRLLKVKDMMLANSLAEKHSYFPDD